MQVMCNNCESSSYFSVDLIVKIAQVYPLAWTAILVKLDNQGMWNLRSQNAENWYLGQELYIRVKGIGQDDPSTIPIQDEARILENVIKCGKTTSL